MHPQNKQEYLKKMANFVQDVFAEHWPDTPGQPSVYLTLRSADAQFEITLLVDDSGLVIDVTDTSTSLVKETNDAEVL